MSDLINIKRALISVSNKYGIVELASKLEQMGVEIISTGGTLKTLKDAGIHPISVSTFTGAPEIMGGRVKTLHPKVHAGILYRRDNPDDIEQLSQSDYKSIELVIVNLYPFQETVAKKDSDDKEVIENIDIGGPSMIRAAAKNHHSVTVIIDPNDYENLITQMEQKDNSTDLEFRRKMAGKAFAITAQYDSAIADYFKFGKKTKDEKFPDKLNLFYTKHTELRYGENPHQLASAYGANGFCGSTLINASQVSGKELSFNNYGDLDACLDMLLDFNEPFACVLKHANPCGAAVGKNITEAYKLAYESDPLSAYGSIIGLNQEVDLECAELLRETPFVECILAPSYTDDAQNLLKKKKSRRILILPEIIKGRPENEMTYKFIRGGVLAQTADDKIITVDDFQVVSKRIPTKEEIYDMLFGWKVVKHTKSNAIVIAKNGATVGLGMGQTSRVDSSFIAVKRAAERAKNAVVASDAFFPMPDAIEVALHAGVTAFIQPGGSKGDEEAIKAVNSANAVMVFTGVRHFKH